MKSVLGTTVRDMVTGFTGVVTGRVEYITGCNQALVQPKVKEDGSAMPDSAWVDEQRLEAVPGAARVKLDNGASPGFDKAPPRR